ncbi:hypothetical protein GCM10008967_36660 [Bacillus carboniphilus]|uniref:Uncharacterized protein n=1 Tax=Bacillus carboniphilus TaxID=86663 RepID=A0ABN0WNU3_9BACI
MAMSLAKLTQRRIRPTHVQRVLLEGWMIGIPGYMPALLLQQQPLFFSTKVVKRKRDRLMRPH